VHQVFGGVDGRLAGLDWAWRAGSRGEGGAHIHAAESQEVIRYPQMAAQGAGQPETASRQRYARGMLHGGCQGRGRRGGGRGGGPGGGGGGGAVAAPMGV